MTRVIGGSARGRRLRVPAGRGTRPTADRAREGLFSTLQSLVGSMTGLHLADLYAGSGAVGLEALSRGASSVLLVEHDPGALRVLRANVDLVALPGADVRGERVERVLRTAPPGRAYDIVFLDPPYELAADRLAEIVGDLVAWGWVTAGSVVVVERATRDQDWGWPEGVVAERSRRYGESTLWYGRAAIPPDVRGRDAGPSAGE